MLLIYTHKSTNRVKYIFNLIFRDLLGVDFTITNNADEFRLFSGQKLNYSFNSINDELFFCSANLLFDSGIKQQTIDSILFEGIKSPFPVYKKACLPFDPFAAAFFMATRYEEYLPYKKDKYDRFDASESIAYRLGFLKKPVVNIWAKKIAEIIQARYPEFAPAKKKYRFIPTIDIDSAWAYKNKGFVRTFAGYLKSAAELNFEEIAIRTKVLAGLKRDPFDTFTFQFELHNKYKVSPVYFILFAGYAHYDKNVPVMNKKFQSLVKFIADYAEVGIHPSFASNTEHSKLFSEAGSLSKVLNHDVTKSRQHFLKLTFPTTFRNLIDADILEDYSLGYATETGFRAGLCDPFYFYDLDLETETHLKLLPFALMEGSLRDYGNISAFDAMTHIKPIISEVKAVNGTFISLWHNESLSDQNRWVGWRKVYEEMIQFALS